MTRAVAQQVLESRGLLPNHLPDFTTEKGREELKGIILVSLLFDFCVTVNARYIVRCKGNVKKVKKNQTLSY